MEAETRRFRAANRDAGAGPARDAKASALAFTARGTTTEGTTAGGTTAEGSAAAIVATLSLSKRYGDFRALSECSIAVDRGEVFGLLGPNGAGKTTLIRLLLGYLRATSGQCLISGIDPAVDSVAVRRQVAYLPGDARLPRHMHGKSVLKFFAELHPQASLARSLAVAERLELDFAKRVAFMSTGMRQKLALAVVFGLQTPLLILDEPTANLDPTVRSTVLEMVSEAQSGGRTVIFSSHVLSEIEQSCDRVAFLRRGKLARQLVMAELFQRHRITASRPRTPINVPAELAERVTLRTPPVQMDSGPRSRIQLDTAGDLAPLLSWLASLDLEHLRIEPLGLRSVYEAVHLGEELDLAGGDEKRSREVRA